MNLHSLTYRPDIDGLRALAILPVVLFHAFPNLMPGGFIGVDIFFVISGYLITSILLKDIQAGSYSIKTFYARRVRRIFPALGIVLAACLIFGWVMLTPEEYQRLGKHAAGGVIFVSNFMLWKEVGYFDAAANTKPLLHLWSLGIEEQFYIVWPVLLGIIFKRSRNLWWLFAGIVFASFALNIGRISADPSGVFYSPLSRAWELALGAAVAYQLIRPSALIADFIKRYQSSISIMAIAMIVVGFFVIHEKAIFPGWWALLPVIGSALLIICGPLSFINQKFLSNRLLVWVGLISFPLYLWHWPLLSFARIIYSEVPPIEWQISLLITSVILAWLTYEWIEKPIRQSQASRKILLGLIFVLLAIGICGHLINKSKGVPSRQFELLNADPLSLAMGADRSSLDRQCGVPKESIDIFQSCWTKPKEVSRLAVLGDSKGEAIFYGLSRESQANAGWMMIGNMLPIISETSRLDAKNIARTNIALDSLVKNNDIEVVMIGVAVRSLFGVPETYTDEDLQKSPYYQDSFLGLTKTIASLEKAGKKVIFLVDHPGFPDPKSCIAGGMTKNDFLNQFLFRKENPRCSITYEQFQKDAKRYTELIGDLKKAHPRMYVYDPSPLLCDISRNRCEISKNGQFLYSYGDHLSDYGNSMIAKDLLPKISNLLKK